MLSDLPSAKRVQQQVGVKRQLLLWTVSQASPSTHQSKPQPGGRVSWAQLEPLQMGTARSLCQAFQLLVLSSAHTAHMGCSAAFEAPHHHHEAPSISTVSPLRPSLLLPTFIERLLGKRTFNL